MMILSTRLKQEKEGEQYNSNQEEKVAGADPGFFLGGGAPLRNDVTDGEVKKILNTERTYKWKLSGSARQSEIGILCFDWLIHPGVSYSREI